MIAQLDESRLVRSRGLTPRYEGDAEKLILTAEFESNERLRVKVEQNDKINHSSLC